MKRIDKQAKFILAITLVLLGSWLLGSMIYTLPDIEVTEEGFYERVGVEPVEVDLNTEENLSLFLNTLLALVIGILSGSIMSFFVVKNRDLLGQIFTIVIIALGLTVFIYFDMDLKFLSIFRGRDYDLGWLVPGNFNVSDMAIGILSFLFLVLLILVVLSINSLLGSASKKKEYLETEENIEEKKEKVAEGISLKMEKALDELSRGDDIREVIIRVYKDMCSLLEEEGISNEESITPREFKRNAIRTLDLDENIINDITVTFEEARYSIHRLDEGDRERVLQEFKKLKKEVGRLF